MWNLKESTKNGSSEDFARCLMENGVSHINYKNYTQKQYVDGTLASGAIYLSNGQGLKGARAWNDKKDRDQMRKKRAYGICLSCSTSENVSMWMLYSGDRGKKGVAINFSRFLMKSFLNVNEACLGYFESGKFQEKKLLSREQFRLHLTDVVYVENCKDGSVKLTVGDEHCTRAPSVLENRFLFTKSFPWSYEKECRLTVWIEDEADFNEYPFIRLQIPSHALEILQSEKRIIRSPLYTDDSYGTASRLQGEVDW